MDDEEPQLHWLTQALQQPGVTLTMRAMTVFRLKYLDVARSAAESLRYFEEENPALVRWYDEAFMRGSVAFVMSFFAVEAALNEAMVDLDVPKGLWEPIERLQPVAKMEALAALRGFHSLPRGDSVVQRLALLSSIRNGLVHAKAEWTTDDRTHAKLSTQITKMGLPRSPYATESDRAFPVACMSGGAALWAVSSAWDFIGAFRLTSGLHAPAVA